MNEQLQRLYHPASLKEIKTTSRRYAPAGKSMPLIALVSNPYPSKSKVLDVSELPEFEGMLVRHIGLSDGRIVYMVSNQKRPLMCWQSENVILMTTRAWKGVARVFLAERDITTMKYR